MGGGEFKSSDPPRAVDDKHTHARRYRQQRPTVFRRVRFRI